MVGQDDSDVVDVHQHVDPIHELAYLCVGVLFAIKEVDDGVYHDDVWLVKSNLV